jgi:hypothetical protein
VQTMLTVVTQNSRLRRSALSGDRMAIGFGYPHRSVPDARRQVMPRPLMYNIVRVGNSFLSSVYWWRSCPERTEARHRPQIWAHIAAVKAVIFYPLLYAYARVPFRELVGEAG